MSEVKDLWGDVNLLNLTKRVPEPVKILQRQGVALSERTKGRLYGEVLDDGLPMVNGLAYNFYIGVADKPYRTLLFSIKCLSALFDYPVEITNTQAEAVEQVTGRQDFEDKVHAILTSPVTKELLQKLLSVARA